MHSLFGRLLVALFAAILAAPAGAAWHQAKSKHFIIYADLKPADLGAYADRLERFDQAVRHVRGMADPPLTDSSRLTLYVLRSKDAVEDLVGGSGVAGFYSSRASGAVAFVPRYAGTRWDKFDLDAEQIFFHEYSHHLQLHNTSAALPAWVIEGFAEFFATAQIKPDGSVSIGTPPMYRAYGLMNLDELSIEEMVGGNYKRLNAEGREHLYGRGWLLTHYLSFEPSRRGQLHRYVEAIQKGAGALDSAKAAFGDLKKLDRELDGYLVRRSLNALLIDAKVLSIGQATVRPLTPGEAAIMNVHLHSTRGVSGKTAPGVAATARKIAASYPNDPFVQKVLAEAEFDAGNHAAAEIAADRALATDPGNFRAMVYKGRALLEMARTKPEADWAGIRKWFIKANRVDTESAEPLLLHYQTYLYAGTNPTKNAVDGLLYAVALAPQDDGLRVSAVHRMLVEKRLDEARQLFAPISFHPHAPERYRESNAEVMAAIVARDAERALAALESAMNPSDQAAER